MVVIWIALGAIMMAVALELCRFAGRKAREAEDAVALARAFPFGVEDPDAVRIVRIPVGDGAPELNRLCVAVLVVASVAFIYPSLRSFFAAETPPTFDPIAVALRAMDRGASTPCAPGAEGAGLKREIPLRCLDVEGYRFVEFAADPLGADGGVPRERGYFVAVRAAGRREPVEIASIWRFDGGWRVAPLSTCYCEEGDLLRERMLAIRDAQSGPPPDRARLAEIAAELRARIAAATVGRDEAVEKPSLAPLVRN